MNLTFQYYRQPRFVPHPLIDAVAFALLVGGLAFLRVETASTCFFATLAATGFFFKKPLAITEPHVIGIGRCIYFPPNLNKHNV
jgi:uncharacterized membrane protein YedE/YeeE